MVHLHELLWAGSVDPTQHTEPTTARGRTQIQDIKKIIPVASTRGNFVPTHGFYRGADEADRISIETVVIIYLASSGDSA